MNRHYKYIGPSSIHETLFDESLMDAPVPRRRLHLYICPDCKCMQRSTSAEATGSMCGVVVYSTQKICPGRIRIMNDKEAWEEYRRWHRNLEFLE